MGGKREEKRKKTDPLTTRTRLTAMSSLLKIKPFKGLSNGSEDLEGVLDDIQTAAEGWRIVRPSDAESSTALHTTIIRFFKQYLVDGYDAAWWWQMAVPAATNKD